MEDKAREFLAEGTGDLGRGKLSQLPEALRKAVATLPVGQLSEPVRIENGIAVLMVCEREDIPGSPVAAAEAPAPAPTPAPEPVQAAAPVPAPAPADNAQREQVANQIGLKRLNQLAERYLKDLRATAYIERR
ncbi:MAG: peptidylprolyl isomerase [Alphaproteobacteria bacterium]